MSEFLPAYLFMLPDEDSGLTYAVSTDNNGAEVISGINAAYFPTQFASIKATPQAQRGPLVQEFYLQEFWTPMGLTGITSQDVANRALDAGVNMGQGESGRLLQQAVNTLLPSSSWITVDGAIGLHTLAAANSVDPVALLAAFKKARVAYYQAIVDKNPADAKYLAGWTARAER